MSSLKKSPHSLFLRLVDRGWTRNESSECVNCSRSGFTLAITSCGQHGRCIPGDPSCSAFGLLAALKITQQYLYVTSGTASGGVTGYTVEFNGALTPIGGGLSGLNIPRGIVASTNGRFLYTAVTTGGQIIVSAIDPKTGALSTLQTVTFANAYELAMDPLGRYLFATNNAGTVQMYSISSSGALSASTAATSGSPNVMVAVDSQGRYVYAGNSSGAILDGFTLQSNGTLSTSNSFGTGGNRTDFVATGGNYLYVADLAFSLVRSYALGATSTPTSLGTGATTTSVNYLAVNPSLTAVYSLHGASGSIYILPIGANGLASGATVLNAGITVTSIAFDSTGRYAYAVGSANTLVQYQVNSNGTLTSLGNLTTSTTPMRVAVASFSW